MRRWPYLFLSVWMLVSARPAAAAAARASAASRPAEQLAPTLNFGRFGTVTFYRPSPNPRHVVLFVSGDGGWNLGVVEMAKALAQLDTLVVGVDIRHYLKQLAAAKESCSNAAVDFEALSQFVQKKLGLATYTPPVLVGYSSGATLVYATLAQAPPNTFRGAISLGFCPDLPLHKPFCAGHGVASGPGPKGKGLSFLPATNLENPWVALQGTADETCLPDQTARYVQQVKNGSMVLLPKVGHGFALQARWMPQFKEAFQKMTAELPAPEKAAQVESRRAGPAAVDDLPLVEVPAKVKGDRLAVIVSGDGGWAGLDRDVGSALAARGVAVVGLNSLSYFWKERTPELAAKDLERILRHYMNVWNRPRAILIGYSLGADVLPFMANRLPPALLQQVDLIALLGPEKMATFEFHIGEWLGHSSASDLPVLPEVKKLAGKPRLLCMYGEQESASICPTLDPKLGQKIGFSGAHHFGGNYETLADRILKELPATSSSGRP